MNAAVRRLTKRDVEDLLERYDEDPIGALSAALRRVLGDGPDRDDPTASTTPPTGGPPDERAAWASVVRSVGFDRDRETALLAGDHAALDALAAELNELRTIQRPAGGARREVPGG